MPLALCRRHRRPNVVVAYSVAALVAGLGLVAASCGGGNGKPEPPKVVSKTFKSFGDSYVRATEPGTNFGKNTELRVDATPPVRAYIEFQPFGVSGKIERATLRVYALSTSNDGFQVRSVSGPWSESRLNFENAPPVGKVINASGPLAKDNWSSIDITNLVHSPAETLRLALVGVGPTEIALGSRETPRRAPQLVIESRRAAAGS
jgi:hypothetical protein